MQKPTFPRFAPKTYGFDEIAHAISKTKVSSQVSLTVHTENDGSVVLTTGEFQDEMSTLFKVTDGPQIMMLAAIGRHNVLAKATSLSAFNNPDIINEIRKGALDMKADDTGSKSALVCHYVTSLDCANSAQYVLLGIDGSFISLNGIGYKAVVVDPMNDRVIVIKMNDQLENEAYLISYKNLVAGSASENAIAKKFFSLDEDHGWLPISMKDFNGRIHDVAIKKSLKNANGFDLEFYFTDGTARTLTGNLEEAGWTATWGETKAVDSRVIAQTWGENALLIATKPKKTSQGLQLMITASNVGSA